MARAANVGASLPANTNNDNVNDTDNGHIDNANNDSDNDLDSWLGQSIPRIPAKTANISGGMPASCLLRPQEGPEWGRI